MEQEAGAWVGEKQKKQSLRQDWCKQGLACPLSVDSPDLKVYLYSRIGHTGLLQESRDVQWPCVWL